MKAEFNVEYFRIHNWLSYHHGKASKCESQDCKSSTPKRFEWALIKGKKHCRNVKNYIQLCPSCHRKYDITEDTKKNMSESRKGIPAKNKKAVVLNNDLVYDSITQASKLTGIKISSIHNNIKGLSKSTKLGKWEYQQVN